MCEVNIYFQQKYRKSQGGDRDVTPRMEAPYIKEVLLECVGCLALEGQKIRSRRIKLGFLRVNGQSFFFFIFFEWQLCGQWTKPILIELKLQALRVEVFEEAYVGPMIIEQDLLTATK